MPKDFDTVALWYNKELFDAAGVEYPSAGWTWDDLKAAAAKLTDPAAGVYGIAASQFGQENYYNSIAQAGGEVITADGTKTGYDTPEALAGIELWTDLIAAGSSPTAQQLTDTSPEDFFVSGKVAMFQNGSWAGGTYAANPDIADKINVAPLPAGPEGNQSVIHGLANVANAKSAHLDARQGVRRLRELRAGRRDPGGDRHRDPRLQRHAAGLGRRRCRSTTCRSTSTRSRPPCPIPCRRTPPRGPRSRARSSRRSGPAPSRRRTA